MFDLLRGEVRKLVTIRTTLAMMVGAVVVVALGTASTMMSVESGKLTGPIHDQMFYFLGSISLGVFALILGVRSFTDEFRHGTIVSTVLSHPSRRRVFTAKSLVAVLASVVMTIASLAVMVGLAVALSGVKDGQLSFTSADIAAIAGLVAGMAGWTVIGAAVGSTIRHQVAAIVGGLVWVLVVENMASGFLGEASRFFPGQAIHAIANVTHASNLAELPIAAVVLAAYVLLGSVAAGVSLDRRDLI